MKIVESKLPRDLTSLVFTRIAIVSRLRRNIAQFSSEVWTNVTLLIGVHVGGHAANRW